MDRALRDLVWARAGQRCEYCQLPQHDAPLVAFHLEHVTPKQHGGGDDEDNLALACSQCNFHKGPNLSGIDPDTGKVVRLFHPRRQQWQRHFRWQGVYLVGRTRTGRATIAVLALNHPDRIVLRQALLADGLFPF